MHNQQFSNFCSSDAEADIPVVGNVFSFVFTKYPPDWRWRFLKVNDFNFNAFSVVHELFLELFDFDIDEYISLLEFREVLNLPSDTLHKWSAAEWK